MSSAFMTLLTAATATTSAPTSGSDGVAFVRNPIAADHGARPLRPRSTAGSGTMTCTLKLWGYTPADGWSPLGTHATAATKGILNAGSAIDETAADEIDHAEVILGLQQFTRLAAQVTAIGGTSTAVTVTVSARSSTDRD